MQHHLIWLTLQYSCYVQPFNLSMVLHSNDISTWWQLVFDQRYGSKGWDEEGKSVMVLHWNAFYIHIDPIWCISLMFNINSLYQKYYLVNCNKQSVKNVWVYGHSFCRRKLMFVHVYACLNGWSRGGDREILKPMLKKIYNHHQCQLLHIFLTWKQHIPYHFGYKVDTTQNWLIDWLIEWLLFTANFRLQNSLI